MVEHGIILEICENFGNVKSELFTYLLKREINLSYIWSKNAREFVIEDLGLCGIF